MRKEKLLPGLPGLVVVLLLACGPGATPIPTSASPAPPASKLTSTASPTASQTAKPTPTAAAVSFAGKTTTVVVPNAPGASTDIVTRLYAKYLPNFLPGKPAMVVRNIPGGDDTLGANYVYSAKPDGLTVLSASASPSLSQLVGRTAVRYDLTKMTALLTNQTGCVFFVRPGIIDKVEDLPKAKGLIYGYTPGP